MGASQLDNYLCSVTYAQEGRRNVEEKGGVLLLFLLLMHRAEGLIFMKVYITLF